MSQLYYTKLNKEPNMLFLYTLFNLCNCHSMATVFNFQFDVYMIMSSNEFINWSPKFLCECLSNEQTV